MPRLTIRAFSNGQTNKTSLIMKKLRFFLIMIITVRVGGKIKKFGLFKPR